MRPLQIILATAFLLFPFSVSRGSVATKPQQTLIYVATDIHVMDSSLVVGEGEALKRYLGQDRKMLRQSIEAFESIVDSAILHQAKALLLCGDLTKDGEKVSHQRVTRTLEKARQAGLTTFVIPGNHDIRNPYARYFDDDNTSPAEGVTADEFADIYRNFGYNEPTKRDLHSLSYVCEPVPGLTLICIDASQHEKNTYLAHGDAKDERVDGGVISPATLDWILQQADQAKSQGNQVIGMMHQQLVEHVDGLNAIVTTAAIENGDSIAQLLMQHGMHLIFTGHMHYSDAATVWNDTYNSSLTDVTTSSTITYPLHYRVLIVQDNSSCISIDTHRLTSIPSQPDYQAYGLEFQENGMESLIYTVARQYWDVIEPTMKNYFKKVNLGVASITFKLPKTADEFAALTYKYLGEFAIHAWIALFEGNEHEQGAYDKYYKELRKGVYGFLGEIISNDIYVLGKPVGRRKARDMIMEEIDPIVKSMLEDLTHIGMPDEDRTDDLHLNIDLQTGKIQTHDEFPSGIEENLQPMAIRHDHDCMGNRDSSQVQIYNMQGQLVSNRIDKVLPAGCYTVRANGKTWKVAWATGYRSCAAMLQVSANQ